MMKSIRQLGSFFIRYLLVISILVIYFIEPIPVDAAVKSNTLRGLRSELAQLEAKKKANADKKALTQSQIKANTNNIANAENEIVNSRNKIEQAKALIETTDKKIKELKENNEKLMAYFQVMQGENVYMEFITDSSSMTELIMRADAIKQLAKYQQDKLVELNDLIKKNEKLQVDLIKYEAELEQNIVKYEAAKESLQGDLTSLNEIGMDIDDEIKSMKELIQSYVNLGCKEDEDLNVCAAVAGNAQILKPLYKGRVNSICGVRNDPFTGKKKIHGAVDIGGNPEGTKVYSAGNAKVVGIVDATGKYKKNGKTTCGGNQVYIQMTVAGENYIIGYAHLLEIHVKVGDKLNANSVIGLQGGGPKTRKWETCSTGTHLHFAVGKGTVGKNQSLSNFLATKFIVPPGYPKKGGWFYSRTKNYS